jgi:regulatory protein
MSLITDIKTQVKNQEKVSVYIDGKYTFSLTIAQLAEHKKIRINTELTESEISEYKKLSSLTNQYIRMVSLIYARPRSEYELRTKLKSKKLEPEEVEEIIAKLKSAKYLDDENFGKWWVSSRKTSKPISKLKLKAELAQKGINPVLAQEIITENFSSEEELQSLQKLIEKKKDKYEDQQKLMAFLASKGFKYSQIKEALDSLSSVDKF